MKNIFLLFCLITSMSGIAQDKYYTKSGNITFESLVPTFEEIKAKNQKVTVVLKDDGSIAALALVKGFRFKIALMEEHFNENYIESDTYPKATFSGKIDGFDINELSVQKKTFPISGKLTLKGITKPIKAKGTLKKIDGVIHLKSDFEVAPETFGISIPKIVRKKIAKTISVSLDFALTKKQPNSEKNRS